MLQEEYNAAKNNPNKYALRAIKNFGEMAGFPAKNLEPAQNAHIFVRAAPNNSCSGSEKHLTVFFLQLFKKPFSY